MKSQGRTIKPGQGDVVLQEVWRIKDELSASYGRDIDRLFDETRKHEVNYEAQGWKFASTQPQAVQESANLLREEPDGTPDLGQQEKMREFYARFNGNKEMCVEAYAEAERRGEVIRKRNKNDLSPERYASALFADGIAKKWLIR